MAFGGFFSSRRAQVATEYVMLVGICLIIIAGLTAYSFVQYGDSTSINQATQATKELKEAANKVYSLGSGSSIITTISLPSGINSFTAAQNALTLSSGSSGAPSVDIIGFDFNVSGALPTAQGDYTIAVSNNNGVVVFSVV